MHDSRVGAQKELKSVVMLQVSTHGAEIVAKFLGWSLENKNSAKLQMSCVQPDRVEKAE
jgi:hypothetical protein